MSATAQGSRRRAAGAIDGVVLAALVTAASLAFGPTYGGWRWLVAAAGGAVVGAVVAWIGAAFRWHWSLVTLGLIVGYLLAGPALATPSVAISGWLPGPEAIRLLALGVFTSWKQSLTVATPIGTSGALLVVVFLPALVFSAIGTSVATRVSRPRRCGWAMAAPAAMLGVAAVFGTDAAYLPLWAAAIVAVGGLIWVSARAGTLDLRRPISLLAVVAAALAALYWVGPSTTPASPRLALRDSVIPQFDPASYPSPLSSFRDYYKSSATRSHVLFTVTGLPTDSRLRLAALDSYDGIVYSVSDDLGGFGRVGSTIRQNAGGRAVAVGVTIGGYSGVYLPAAGALSGITFSGPDARSLTQDFRYSSGSDVGVDLNAVRSGDSYDFSAVLPADLTDEQWKNVSIDTTVGAQLAPPSRTDPSVQALVDKLSQGADSVGTKILAMRDGFQNAAHLSHGGDGEPASRSGHGLDRIRTLFTDPNLTGDQEQYATGFSLMLWSAGIPNRVVMGFTTTGKQAGTMQITGGDLSAWVEVPVVGHGWVTVDPNPTTIQNTRVPKPAPQPDPKPQVLQPPPPPPVPAQANSSDAKQQTPDDKKNDPTKKKNNTSNGSGIGGILAVVGLSAGIPILVVGLPVLLVLLLKRRRRQRRRVTGSAADRISGGWYEMVDQAVDLGHHADRRATRPEAAAALDQQYGTGTVALARRADARIFGPEQITDEEVRHFWAEVDAALLGLRGRHGRWRRLRAKLSLASLRRSRKGR